MVTEVPLFSTPLPDPLQQTSEEFESSTTTMVSELNPRFAAANTQAAEVNAMALNAESAVAELANTVWVSGTTYAAGNVRYSPVDFYVYRRKTAGAGTTDPSLDTTNWALQTKTSAGGSDTTSSAVDITLTATSGRLQIVAMTAPNKNVYTPAATTLSKGAHVFVIKNAGLYRFAVRKNGGVFLTYINPGQVIAFGCSDISTSAGVWAVSGDALSNIYDGNSAEVLNAVGSRFIAVAMLSATKAICAYKNDTSTFLEAVILNFGSASGTPLAITSEAVRNISIAAQTSSQATVVYQQTANSNIKGYVLDVSGSTITPGTVAAIQTTAGTGAEGTALCALTSTKLLLVYLVSGATTLQERILDISGSAITAGTAATADSTTVISLYMGIKRVSDTKALAASMASSGQIQLRLQAISGSTPSATGSVLSLAAIGTTPQVAFGLCVLSDTRAIVIRSIDRLYGDIAVYIIDISSTTPVLVTIKQLSVGLTGVSAHISAAKLDSNRVHVTFAGAFSLGADGLTLTITSDDRVVVGQINERLEPTITSSFGFLACDALDSSHVMQVCRNASTFLSAKTLEIS